ncbi:acyltransferase family protein [Pseudomonas aeruginosa]|uniref:acyltransferase family protein n=1 Tax=Pseudomonas aeruginosa TaxID=287 RepID=UPI0018C48AB5|nr:acyltransferase family protein [Pseudomonas aeruginosa]MCO5370296.1 acyltransferase [Pseudomonas aeruginosa]HEJ3411758.1 acyltransferase [Pseudomonas aeruginosa]HEJ3987754.1 acyltransferase [Pseudomonas aeruginosa]
MNVNSGIRISSGYKPFIDGLRAFSILAVVLYHAGVPMVYGGFVGVDIFFVISGFLIVTHIVSSIQDDRFSFGEFWARRALRILPPYLLVLFVCSAIAPFILVLPREINEFGDQVIYSALMLVNHYFLGQQGYFDGLSETKPLLHLWSLSVEEQFYIVAPVVIFLLYVSTSGLGKTKATVISLFTVSCVFAVSLYGCIALSGDGAGKNYSFFLMPLRAWEFIAGGAIAFAVPFAQRLGRLVLEIISIAGAVMLFYAIFVFNGKSPYPAGKAVVPVVGAALIILCGVSNHKILVSRILSFRVFVMIGLVSYAWYLWHWPLLTFGRIYSFGHKSIALDLSMVAIAFVLACITYVYVDKKVLNWRKSLKHGASWKHSAYAVAFCIPALLSGVYISKYMSVSVGNGFTEAQIPRPPSSAGNCNLHLAESPSKCLSIASGKEIGILVGDSHADAAYRGIARHASSSNSVIATLSSGGCAAIFNVHINNPDVAMRERCENGRKNAIRMLKDINPKYAVLFSSWSIYSGRGYYSLGGVGPQTPLSDVKRGFVSKVGETIDFLKSTGVERILIIGPVPIFKTSAPNCVIRSLHYRISPDKNCSVSRDEVEKSRKDVVLWLKEAADDRSGVKFIDPINAFCDESKCRSYGDEGVLYTDTNHISDAGLERVYKNSKHAFDWLMNSDTRSVGISGSL